MLHVFYSRIRLYLAVYDVIDFVFVQNIGYFFSNAELYKIGVGTNESLFKASAFDFGSDFFNRALAVITCFVQNKSVCHNFYSLNFFQTNNKPFFKNKYTTLFKNCQILFGLYFI